MGGFDQLSHAAGLGVGVLSGLASIRHGGLLNYMGERERLMNDPGFRAGLVGSPFASGFWGVGGSDVAQPGGAAAAGGGAAQPPAGGPDFVGPVTEAYPAPVAPPGAPAFVPGYVPGAERVWRPDLPPYSPDVALKQQAAATTIQGIQSNDIGQRAQYKMAAGIPLTSDEYNRSIDLAAGAVRRGGAGTTVRLDVPGAPVTVGSPYNLAPVTTEEYSTYGEAAAVAATRGTS